MKYMVMFRYHLTDLKGEITEYKLSFSVESGSIAEAVRKAKDESEQITRGYPFRDMKELEVIELS